jgi:Caspase domain
MEAARARRVPGHTHSRAPATPRRSGSVLRAHQGLTIVGEQFTSYAASHAYENEESGGIMLSILLHSLSLIPSMVALFSSLFLLGASVQADAKEKALKSVTLGDEGRQTGWRSNIDLFVLASPVDVSRPIPSKASVSTCRQLEAGAKSLASNIQISFEEPNKLKIFDVFKATVTLPSPTEFRSNNVVRVVLAISGNARLESDNDDVGLFEPNEPINDVTGALNTTGVFDGMQRASIHYDPMSPPKTRELQLRVRVLDSTPVALAWTVIGGQGRGCAPKQLIPVAHSTYNVGPNTLDTKVDASDSCNIERQLSADLARETSISFDVNESRLRVGEDILVKWRRGHERFPTNRPTFIVFSMPDWVRVEGPGIVAVPQNGVAPANIKFGAPSMRIFVPLHMLGSAESGSFRIKPFRASAFSLEYGIVTKTLCGERTLSSSKRDVVVSPGAPQVFIQEQFTLDKPNKVIISDNRDYRLEIFDRNYKVYDKSGTLVIERSGRFPNFSPTGRFLAAFIGNEGVEPDESARMELIDLVATKPVSIQFEGPILGWAAGDAVLIEGTYPRGELKVRQPFLDPTSQDSKGQPKCLPELDDPGLVVPTVSSYWRESSAWETLKFRLYIEAGILILVDSFDRISVWELATGFKLSTNKKQLSTILNAYNLKDAGPPTEWEPGESLKLSHYSPKIDEILPWLLKVHSFPGLKDTFPTRMPTRDAAGGVYCVSGSHYAYFPVTRDQFEGTQSSFRKQRPFLVEHRIVSGSELGPVRLSLGPDLTKGDWRSKAFAVADTPVPVVPIGRYSDFSAQLGSRGIFINDDIVVPNSLVVRTEWARSSVFKVFYTPIFSGDASNIEKDLLTAVPEANQFINTLVPDRQKWVSPDGPGWFTPYTTPCNGPLANGAYSWRFQDHARGVWTWGDTSRTYWLVQMQCFWKGSERNKLYLFAKDSKTKHTLFDPLFQGAQSGPSDALGRVRPCVVAARWLIVTFPGTAAVVDLKTPDHINLFGKLQDTSALDQVFLSTDGKWLIQLNTNGALFGYKSEYAVPVYAAQAKIDSATRAKSAKLVTHSPDTIPVAMRGRWIDNELLLYTDQGYYWGSSEAGHFVNLLLPGVSTLYTLDQFASKLNRPDIVSAAMRGEPTPEGPQMSTPPAIFVEANAGEHDKLRVTLSTQSATSLRMVRLFIDGQLMSELHLSQQSATLEIFLDWPPQARILSAIAIDDNGLSSSVASKVLPLKAGLGGRLVGLAVGVDEFQDSTLNLHYAASDVKRVEAALTENKSGFYGEVLIEPLLNDNAQSEKIISKLEEKVASAAMTDTLLFFFSGHGVRDKNGALYLAAGGTSLNDLSGTGLAWGRVASVLKKSKSRVIVILDACHAGLGAMTTQLATNDQIASEFSSVDISIVILAAANVCQRKICGKVPRDLVNHCKDRTSSPLHTGGVTGSIPVAPTTGRFDFASIVIPRPEILRVFYPDVAEVARESHHLNPTPRRLSYGKAPAGHINVLYGLDELIESYHVARRVIGHDSYAFEDYALDRPGGQTCRPSQGGDDQSCRCQDIDQDISLGRYQERPFRPSCPDYCRLQAQPPTEVYKSRNDGYLGP